MLPKELQIAILLRLPIKSLLRFKSVCQQWHSLFRSQIFTHRYSQISQSRNDGKVLHFRNDETSKTHKISIIDPEASEKITDLEWPPFPDEGINNKEDFTRVINVLGPINGVYCLVNRLVDRWTATIILWNPATKEYHHITPLIAFPFSFEHFGDKWDNNWYYDWKRPVNFDIGFGYDYNTNDFKVVNICYWASYYGDDEERWLVRVYNKCSDSWRTIYYLTSSSSDALPIFEEMSPYFPEIISYPEYVHCYLNGLLHWCARWIGDKGIMSFDMTNECFKLMRGPPPILDYHCPFLNVWVLKGTLAMVVSTVDEDSIPRGVHIWMMMQYGVEDSWTMAYSFGPTLELPIIHGVLNEGRVFFRDSLELTMIGIPNDNLIFLRDENGQLVSVNFDGQEFKEYGLYGASDSEFKPNAFGGQGVLKYVETLTSVK